jgi:hypothetical protein
MLLSQDSHGTFRGLSRAQGYEWVPLLDPATDPKLNSSDVYWPVGLLEQKMMCAVCKVRLSFSASCPLFLSL